MIVLDSRCIETLGTVTSTSRIAELPKIAVCIPTYNQGRYLESAIRSAFAQNYRGPTEVWVASDASTDNSHEILQRLLIEFSNLRIVTRTVRLGIARNASELMQLTDANFIVRLDSDDLLYPDYVSRMVSALEEFPCAGYAHCAVNEIDEIGRFLRVRNLARRSGVESPEVSLRKSLRGYRVAANIITFRSSALRKCGWYLNSPDFGEDYDLSIHMADLGYGNVYVDEVLAKYRVWNDANHRRSRRKPDEISGLARILDETLAPAFRKRKWDCAGIARRKREIALAAVQVYSSDEFTSDEQRELFRELRAFGGSRQLELRIAASKAGLGFFFSWWESCKRLSLNSIKQILREIRRTW